MTVPIPCLYCHGLGGDFEAGSPTMGEWLECRHCEGSGVLVLDHVGHDEPPEDDQGTSIARAA